MIWLAFFPLMSLKDMGVEGIGCRASEGTLLALRRGKPLAGHSLLAVLLSRENRGRLCGRGVCTWRNDHSGRTSGCA